MKRRVEPGETFRMGGHIYGMCFDCHQIVKLTGFWKGIHFCLEEAQRAKDVQP